VPQDACDAPPVQSGALFDPPASVAPWQYTAQVAVARSQVGGGVTPLDAVPEKVTVAVVALVMWPAVNMSATGGWQTSHAKGGASAPPVTCTVWAPVRKTAWLASARTGQVTRGGAPVWLSFPPWHPVHVSAGAGPAVLWQSAHATLVIPPTPSRSGPWQIWQLASPWSAE
jgi:hypothetical protein